MRWLASLYWHHEKWILDAVVSNRFVIALLRLETLAVWCLLPMAFPFYILETTALQGAMLWILKALPVIGMVWFAFGFFWRTYFLGYLVEAVSWNSPIATSHPNSGKRLRLLERRIGAP